MDILVIEDDPSVRTLVQTVLQKDDNHVDLAETASGGESQAYENPYDVIVLDLGLPDGDGFEVCKRMRDENITTPVLILSAEQETDVKIKCLRVGADDYITKPFNTEELLARIEAITRRNNGLLEDRTLTCGELEVDVLERIFRVNGTEVDLTNNEFNLLVYLLKNKNQIVTQEEIAVNVWDIHFDTQTNYINVYISYLRKKIRNHSDKEYIDTVRKKGFIMHCGQ
ncbi:two-component system, OmpR family, response regulator/two-component system, OmpR family, response regulator CiaR [Fodinibius salinus]|uniref:Two-component system, OmpR family, response regulator/two-component system, OmpR family, response regulator CiaR n=1 Tax=Fodinibius salinus TaxID=860790 RepID=A0A5D3YP73_9BACT|nr:response regulator transcription factor [Fodinibius salinus]TYP95502.1 two-component system, OmpR family, response regulator/two-component system, OmpR family, response regulator CiaR [Fodinibius salinus]